MLNNINTTDENIYYLGERQRNGARVVKLSNFTPFYSKTSKLKEEYRSSHQEPPKEENNTPQPVENTSEEATPNNVTEAPTNETSNILPFTPQEVLLSKKDSLGIVAYQDTESNVVNLQDYQNARRLRVNEVVVGNANRTRNVLGTSRISMEVDSEVDDTAEVDNSPFDFGNAVNASEEKHGNDAKLDEWLNKETVGQPLNTDDAMLNEVNELQNKRNDNANSLATQKEILEALRARIANNEELCRQRKLQLEEENLALTQELNDVLAEINQLTSLANEQEAFLGISDAEVGKSKAA